MPTPDLLRTPNASQVGRATSLEKLNGQVYTPLPVAEAMLARVRWPEDAGGTLLDPACGDGVFLEAAIRKAARILPRTTAIHAVTHRMAGWDIDPVALAICRARLAGVLAEVGLPPEALPQLIHRDALAPPAERVRCVVGNPPYLEAKRMPQGLKARLRSDFPGSTSGAFDLYGVFLDRALSLVEEEEGEVCFIIPNRVLVTLATRDLRRYLLASCQVEVVDLSEERVFDDAAVYPVVIRACRSDIPYFKVAAGFESGTSVMALPSEALLDRLDALMPLPPRHPGARGMLGRLLLDERLVRFDARFDTRWTISFHKAGLRDLFTFPERPDSPHARPFLGGGRFQGNREVDGYRVTHEGWWIDYDTARARAAGNAFPDPSLFEGPKVALCQNARRGRAALDQKDRVLKDTFLAIRGAPGIEEETGLAELDWLAWVVLWLNSDFFHFLYEHLYGGTRKGGAFLHFLPRYLAPLPLASPPAPGVALALLARVQADLGRRGEVEGVLREAWGVTPEEAEALDAYGYPEG
ncbi:MAG: N-6 DNA methylase [Pseudomonadota bacterium]